ncbi:killer cell lectin-like receptor subfamily B member 1B allele B [Polypterus senegalus]|uniref:killer cell lectin-like receptor subfamily B member 1B allele B n=1 Tax=Polypterus senegalus TaxID=55291 RepID=UPI00196502BF|nr:killer cell lectin-like receptor subfamily B member 1B allele B [Polypterus senegalus]
MQVKSNCYYISVRRSTWAESNKHCSSHGAQLVVIEDQEGLEFLFLQCRRFLTFWIGLNRSPQEEWRWVNNELFNHSRWTLGVSAGGHCACVAQESIESLNCSSQHHWICRMAVANY